MLSRQERTPDSRDGYRRAMADLVYHASGRMDEDTFDEFQAQCFTLISNYQLAARRKRESRPQTITWQPTVLQQMQPPAYPLQPQPPQPAYVAEHLTPQHQAYVAQQVVMQPQSQSSQAVGQPQRSPSVSYQLQSRQGPTYSAASAAGTQADSATAGSSSSNIIGQAVGMMNVGSELGDQSFGCLLNQLSSTPEPSTPTPSQFPRRRSE